VRRARPYSNLNVENYHEEYYYHNHVRGGHTNANTSGHDYDV
jgi:hypothetical protein